MTTYSIYRQGEGCEHVSCRLHGNMIYLFCGLGGVAFTHVDLVVILLAGANHEDVVVVLQLRLANLLCELLGRGLHVTVEASVVHSVPNLLEGASAWLDVEIHTWVGGEHTC